MQGHRIQILGNLGQDPTLRYTQDGTEVTSFSVAANRRWTDAGGEKSEEAVWFRVTVWRKLAIICNEYLQKGRQVLVEGRMRVDPETGGPRIWTDRDGNPRASFEITAQSVVFLGGNGNDRGSRQEPNTSESEEPYDSDEEGVDIPF